MSSPPRPVDYRGQLQSSLGTAYTLERELGGGGMSRVFLAEERALGRKVVVKVLAPELSAGVNADRFSLEIQLAARLQQAQIVPVLSAGEVNGIQYYTMPFVEGESLRAKLARDGALPIPQVVNVLRDVTRALAYAHEHGVVHRDIKPDNVLLSGGTAVVTDFGIAKAISAARAASTDTALTQLGTSVGTPAYISPEQAAGDPDIDHRADIYSLGCMAYELLTGEPPFAGRTPQRTLAAHLTETPAHVESRRPDAPPALAALVMQCLAKDPAARPQSAAEITAALDAVTTGSSGAMPAMLLSGPGATRRALLLYAAAFVAVALVAKAAVIAIGLPDWVFTGAIILMAAGLPLVLATAFGASRHLTWRRAIRVGALSLGTFATAIVAIMILRLFGIGPAASLLAAGTFQNRQPLLVADFAAGRDTSLSHVVTEAVRTDLGQSQVVSIMPPSAVAAALTRMQRPSVSTVDLPLAREIAQREGVKAIVAGSVTPLGAGYVVSVRLVASDSGNELAAYRKTVDAPSQLLDAIDELTRKLRGRIGESLKSVHDAPRLDQVTTSSLESLRKYAEANRAFDLQGDYLKAASILREAVAIDTTFAMAYRKLGISLSNAGMPHAQIDSALTQAYRYSPRLPEKERYTAIGSYYQNGPDPDRRKAADAWEHVLSVDSMDPPALNNLANVYRGLRQFARAETLYHRLAASPGVAQVSFSNYVGTLFGDGKIAQAESAYAEWQRRMPPSSAGAVYPAAFMYARGQIDSSEAYWRARRADPNLTTRINAVATLASFARLHGRLREADSLVHVARAMSASMRALPRDALADSLSKAVGMIRFLGENERGVNMLDAALARTPLRTMNSDALTNVTIGGISVASAYAQAGRTDKARAVLAVYDNNMHDARYRVAGEPARHQVLGEIALAEQRPLDAVREFWRSDSMADGPNGDCYFCKDVLIGRAYDLANMPDSAIKYLERFVDAKFPGRVSIDDAYLPAVHEWLGELYESKGDTQRAASHYAAFIDLWKNADPELQPRVMDAKRRFARLPGVAGR